MDITQRCFRCLVVVLSQIQTHPKAKGSSYVRSSGHIPHSPCDIVRHNDTPEHGLSLTARRKDWILANPPQEPRGSEPDPVCGDPIHSQFFHHDGDSDHAAVSPTRIISVCASASLLKSLTGPSPCTDRRRCLPHVRLDDGNFMPNGWS